MSDDPHLLPEPSRALLPQMKVPKVVESKKSAKEPSVLIDHLDSPFSVVLGR